MRKKLKVSERPVEVVLAPKEWQRLREDQELLRKFGAELSGHSGEGRGLSATLPGVQNVVGLAGNGFWGEPLCFNATTWKWLKPLLAELSLFRAAREVALVKGQNGAEVRGVPANASDLPCSDRNDGGNHVFSKDPEDPDGDDKDPTCEYCGYTEWQALDDAKDREEARGEEKKPTAAEGPGAARSGRGAGRRSRGGRGPSRKR